MLYFLWCIKVYLLWPKYIIYDNKIIIKYGGRFMKFDEWNGFTKGDWEKEIDVRDFIQKNYTPYELSLIHI